MIHRLRQVADGLYRGSAPSPKDVLWLKQNLGINKIVSLDEKTGEKIDRACKMLKIKHEKAYVNMDRKSLTNLLKHNLKKLLLDGGPTFFHCEQGKDRTGLAAALFKCKYMGVKPEEAIQEAKSLGFGIGVDPKIVALYEKLIRGCKPAEDVNNVDIVSNEREYISDNRSSFLDEGHQGSFAPYLSKTRQYPYDAVYNYINEQSPTRENYQSTWSDKKQEQEADEDGDVPLVGQYDSNAGGRGFGPVEPNPGGFIND